MTVRGTQCQRTHNHASDYRQRAAAGNQHAMSHVISGTRPNSRRYGHQMGRTKSSPHCMPPVPRSCLRPPPAFGQQDGGLASSPIIMTSGLYVRCCSPDRTTMQYQEAAHQSVGMDGSTRGMNTLVEGTASDISRPRRYKNIGRHCARSVFLRDSPAPAASGR